MRKQPKVYPWDWSAVRDEGARVESFAASHLLKAVHWWSDLGLGEFELFYLRDTAQREVDFLIVRDSQPWIMIEVKKSMKEPISASLRYFAEQLAVPYAFQAVMEADYVDADCFGDSEPRQTRLMRVPLRSLLSQWA